MPRSSPEGGDLDRVLVEQAGLDRPLHTELAEEVGHEGPPDLTLLFERHSFGHVLLSPSLRCSAAEPSQPPAPPSRSLEPSTDADAGARRLAAIAAAAGRAAGAAARPGRRRACAVRAAARAVLRPGLSAAHSARRRRAADARWPDEADALPALAAALATLAATGPPLAAPRALPPGPGPDRAHPGPHPGLDPDPSEQPRLGLVHHDDLGVADGDPQLVQCLLGRFFDGLARHLNPLHALSSLSCPSSSATAGGPWVPEHPRRLSSLAALPFVVCFPAAGFLPFVGARPLVFAPFVLAALLAGGSVALAAAVPSVAVDVFFDRFGGGGFSLVSLSFDRSRSRVRAADRRDHAGPEHHFLRPDAHGRRNHHVNGCSGGHS